MLKRVAISCKHYFHEVFSLKLEITTTIFFIFVTLTFVDMMVLTGHMKGHFDKSGLGRHR